MIAHHLRFALLMLARHRAYAAITIGGLALGLAGCLLILSYVRYERGWDRWVPGYNGVFQVQTTWRETGQPVVRAQTSPYPVRDRMRADFPRIDALTVVRDGMAPVVRAGAPVFVRSATVDPDFFRVFPLRFLHGDAASALRDTRSIVLTRTAAIAQFGTPDVLGRTLSIGAGVGRQDYRVGAVVADLPRDTSLRFDLLFRWDPAMAAHWPEQERDWGALGQMHFVRLHDPADAAAINAALPAWERRVMTGRVMEGGVSRADIFDLSLVPLARVHLGPAQTFATVPGGDARALATFTIVALLTLAMAVANFVNLSTARATQRAREIAVRKVLGATRRQLTVQMLVESFLVTGIATVLALALVELVAPWIAQATGAVIAARYLGEGGMLAPAAMLFVLTALAGGAYPAFRLSRIAPGGVLRINRAGLETPGSARLRTGLVLVQFAIAIGLVACTLVIQRQTDFLATLDPGYRRDGLIQLKSVWRMARDEAEFRAASRAFADIPGVVSVGRTNLGIAATNKTTVGVRSPGVPPGTGMGSYAVDPGFFATMGLRLVAGRLPSATRTNDLVDRDDHDMLRRRSAVIVLNRTAVRTLRLGDPDRAIGRTIRLGLDYAGLTPATVIGVVEDARVRTARDAIEALTYVYDPQRTDEILIRYAGADPRAVMAGVRAAWQRFEPDIPFNGRFGEDILAEQITGERARGALFLGFAILAGVIACLGLYSLAAFAVERRRKEIGIRKVLGATVRHIVQLLAWQFSRPVVAANVVAWPVAWWAMRDWLNGFDVRVPLGPAPFLIAAALALGIAVATVAGHAWRAARLHPVHALRHE